MENDARKRHKCDLCNYSTNRKYDLNRHQNAIHNLRVPAKSDFLMPEQNVHQKNQMYIQKNQMYIQKNQMYILKICVKNVIRFIKSKKN